MENESINYNDHMNNVDLNKLSTIREEDSKFKHLYASSDVNHEYSKDTNSVHDNLMNKLDSINYQGDNRNQLDYQQILNKNKMLTKYMNEKLDWSKDEIDSNDITNTTLRSKSKSLNKYNIKDKDTNNSHSSINSMKNNNSYL